MKTEYSREEIKTAWERFGETSLRVEDINMTTKTIVKPYNAKHRFILRWSCSDSSHHEHRFQWTARICGWVQSLFAKD